MISSKHIITLVRKEFILEFRNKVSISSILMYLISTIFICFQSFKAIENVPVWNALFWIIILFAAINSVTKSFSSESKLNQYYFYLLSSPQNIIIAKMIYNFLMITVLSFISYLFFSFIFGNLGDFPVAMWLVLLLGSFGISCTLTFVSAIASKTNNNLGMVSILSFPILMPLFITLIKLSKNAMDQISFSVNQKYIFTLLGLDIVIIVLAIILFPYLWRE